MAYEGWLSVAGTEVINNDRVRAYAKELTPSLTVSLGRDDEADEALRKILADKPYSTPLFDEAPWYDPDDPDTADFCGVLGLGVTGLSDSTRTATTVEHNQSGGGFTGVRKAVRNVRYSALLVGASMAAVEAGHNWLSMALEGDCDADCNGSYCCYLNALTNPEDWGDLVTVGVNIDTLVPNGAKGTYDLNTQRWSPKTSTEELRVPKFPPPLPCDEIVWTWTVQGPDGTQVTANSYGDTGKVFTDRITIDSDGEATFTISDRGMGTNIAYCGIQLTVGSYVTVKKVTVTYREEGINEACFNHYQRQLFEVTPIDGPTTVEEYATSCGAAIRKVEFTIATGIPWTYGRYRAIYSGSLSVGSDQEGAAFKLSKTIGLKTTPQSPTWVRDPACPVVPSPPRPTATFTDCKPSTAWHDSYGIAIPKDSIPLWGDAVPRLLLTTGGKEARGVRVRFFPRPLGILQDAVDLDPNTACGEFMVDYIPASSTFYLDGLTRHCQVKRPGYAISPADHLVGGLTASQLFQWPVLTCGMDYMMILDVDGENQSLVSTTLYIASRWG